MMSREALALMVAGAARDAEVQAAAWENISANLREGGYRRDLADLAESIGVLQLAFARAAGGSGR